MTTELRNLQDAYGNPLTLVLKGEDEGVLNAQGRLLALPALIDPHVHFRTPGAEYKENWVTASRAAVAGGITTVFDMPNTSPSTITLERLRQKQQQVESQLSEAGVPLHAHFFLGAHKDHFSEIARCKKDVVGLKVFMGSSTGDLLMDDDASIEEAFRLGAESDLIVAVHAEEEAIIATRHENLFAPNAPPSLHSEIRHPTAALKAVDKAIDLAQRQGTKLYILHLSTKGELDLVRQAKKQGFSVYCEVTPHHLFLDISDYEKWGTLVQMNPPLRTAQDREALWEGIHDGTVDSLGTDHAPHTLDEKAMPYGKAPSGVPGLETVLPLMLQACHEGRLTLSRLVELTHTRVKQLYNLPQTNDWVLVDPNLTLPIAAEALLTKCGWSPFAGWNLTGWPIATTIDGNLYRNPNTFSKSYAAECITPMVAGI